MIFKVHAYIHNYNYPKVVPLVGCPRWLSGKRITCQCRRCRRRGFDPWGGKILWRRKYQPASVFLPGRSHGQRSLADYSPWDCKELDMTAQLSTHMTLWELFYPDLMLHKFESVIGRDQIKLKMFYILSPYHLIHYHVHKFMQYYHYRSMYL